MSWPTSVPSILASAFGKICICAPTYLQSQHQGRQRLVEKSRGEPKKKLEIGKRELLSETMSAAGWRWMMVGGWGAGSEVQRARGSAKICCVYTGACSHHLRLSKQASVSQLRTEAPPHRVGLSNCTAPHLGRRVPSIRRAQRRRAYVSAAVPRSPRHLNTVLFFFFWSSIWRNTNNLVPTALENPKTADIQRFELGLSYIPITRLRYQYTGIRRPDNACENISKFHTGLYFRSPSNWRHGLPTACVENTTSPLK